MIKLEKEDLQVLERANEIVQKLRLSSIEENETLDLFMIELNIEGIILYQNDMEKKGVE